MRFPLFSYALLESIHKYKAWMFKFIETEKAGEYTREKSYEMPTDFFDQTSKMSLGATCAEVT